MSVIMTKTHARCGLCREIVPRGVRRKDAAWVAVCQDCGTHPIQDIEQPAPHALSEEEIMEILSEGVYPTRTGHYENADPKNRPILRRMDMAKLRLGLSWEALSASLGKCPSYLTMLRARLRKGARATKRVMRYVETMEAMAAAIDEAQALPRVEAGMGVARRSIRSAGMGGARG